jgi:hypothetical protein
LEYADQGVQAGRSSAIVGKSRVSGSTRLARLATDRWMKQVRDHILNETIRLADDVVIISEGLRYLDPSLVKRLKAQTGAIIILLCGLSPVALLGEKVRASAPYFDFIFCSDRYHKFEWRELGARNAMVLPISACGPELHHPIELTVRERRELECDIAFVGRLSPLRIYHERVGMLRSLSDFDLAIWTADTEIVQVDPLLARHYRSPARGQYAVKVDAAARIALNAHGHTMQRGGNMRLFEVPATGTFQLTDRCDPAWFMDQQEIVLYSGPDDLARKARDYLQNDSKRMAIAGAGMRRAHAEHTYGHLASRLLDILTSMPQANMPR